MSKRQRDNKIIADHWEYLEVDISTPLHPDVVMKIDHDDWEYLQRMPIGRIRAQTYREGMPKFPVAKQRSKNYSILYLLFRSPGGIKCISEDFCDIRRANLENGDKLIRAGEEGHRRVKRSRANPRSGATNEVRAEKDGLVYVDISTRKFPDAEIKLTAEHWEKVKEVAKGRVTIHEFYSRRTLLPSVQVLIGMELKRKCLATILFGDNARMEDTTSEELIDLTESNITYKGEK